LSSYQNLSDACGTPPQRNVEAIRRIIKLYESWGKADKAEEWHARELVQRKQPQKGSGTRKDK